MFFVFIGFLICVHIHMLPVCDIFNSQIKLLEQMSLSKLPLYEPGQHIPNEEKNNKKKKRENTISKRRRKQMHHYELITTMMQITSAKHLFSNRQMQRTGNNTICQLSIASYSRTSTTLLNVPPSPPSLHINDHVSTIFQNASIEIKSAKSQHEVSKSPSPPLYYELVIDGSIPKH